MNKWISTILVIVVVIVGGILLFGDNTPKDEPTTPPLNGQSSIPADWERYESEQFAFVISHPEEATVDVEAGNNIKFQLLGPDNQPGTEVQDGFTFTVSAYQKEQYNSLRSLAEARAESIGQAGEVTAVTQTTFRGERAYEFTSATIGEVNHLFTEGPAYYYQLSSNVTDPQNRGYAETVDMMIASFTVREGEEDATTNPPLFSKVNIALLDTTPEGDVERGCDDVVMIERDVPQTTQPLTAALEELFSIEEEQVDGNYNFIARTNDTLSFDRAVVESGVASIYLAGELSGLAGVCDNPRAAIQIEETALQFPTVKSVTLYLNGEQTDLIPSEQGV